MRARDGNELPVFPEICARPQSPKSRLWSGLGVTEGFLYTVELIYEISR